MSQRGSLPVPDTWSRQYRWNKALSPQAIADPLWGVTRYEADRNGQIVTASHGGAMQPGALPLLARAVPSGIPGFPADTQETERFSYAATLDVAGSDTTLPQQPGGRALSSWQSSAGGRVEAARGPHGETIRFSHDENGRVSERRVERNGFRPLVWRFTWDGFDRMIGVVCPDGAAWAYLYDPFGRRIEKRLLRAGENSTHAASGSGMRFVWDGHVVAAEAPLSASADGGRHADVSSAVWWHFDPGGFVPLLREDAAGGAVLHVITDHLGTPRELVDETGDLAWSASYRLWGGLRGLWTRPANDNAPLTNNGPGGMVRLASAGNAALDLYADWQDGTQTSLAPSESQQAASARLLCPIRFQGQWEDTETGLCYNRFRTYDPLSAQYMSPDPIGIEGGYRTHGYAENPRVWVDPLGLSRCDQLLEDIFNKTKLFHAEMLKYDPIADARGGFPSYRSGTLKLTVPGGHYMKLRNYQQGILKDLAAYAKEGCYKCATPNDYRKLAAASRVVSTDVKIPAGVPRIILPNGK